MHATIREPAVAGLFYDDQPERLTHVVDHFLAAARSVTKTCPKALIVPHAGLRYSGPVAAEAYHTLLPWAESLNRVVLLGPSHRVPLRGMAVPTTEAFRTPLGRVPVDATLCQRLRGASPAVMAHDLPHRFEHCLEVQLPFLQRVLPTFTIAPVVVGETPADEVAAVIQRVWGAPGTLIVVSSDLSHYHTYEMACERDRQTAESILSLTPCLTGEDACGCYAVNGLLQFAREHNKCAELLCLKNSGDTAGDKSRVVGYGAFAFFDAA